MTDSRTARAPTELTFIEKITMKFGIAAVHAVKAYLDHRGVRPTSAQLGQISRAAAPLVLELVAKAAPSPDAPMEVFNDLFERACLTAIEVAELVINTPAGKAN